LVLGKILKQVNELSAKLTACAKHKPIDVVSDKFLQTREINSTNRKLRQKAGGKKTKK
jgi:hypothetical protein